MKGRSAKNMTLLGPVLPAADPGRMPHPKGTARPRVRTLWIRTASGPAIGFGHLRRSLILARRLRSFARPVFLLDPEDIWSRKEVSCRRLDVIDYCARQPWPDRACPAALLIDTRRRPGIRLLVREAHRRGIPVISIHDLGLMSIPSDMAIDGSIRPFAGGFPPQGRISFGGPEYLVLDPAFAALHLRPKRVKQELRRLTVNLGGGNSRRYFENVLQGLQAAGLDAEVIGIPGFMDWGQREFERTDRRALRFRWAAPGETVAELLWSADLAITAGGLSAYEALCVGTPLCALSWDRHQRVTVKALAREGACLDLGAGSSLQPRRMAARIARLGRDPGHRRRLSRRGRQLVDGLGVRRVAGRIRALAAGRARRSEMEVAP